MIILVSMCIVLFFIIIGGIYNCTSHSSYKDVTLLRDDAKPIDLKRRIVGSKGSKKFRTTIVFDDGFTYVSHKTNVENYLIYRKISVSAALNKEIIEDAVLAHKREIENSRKG